MKSIVNLILYYILLLKFSVSSYSPSQDSSNSEWGYKSNQNFKSPDQWKDIPNATCAGIFQSPINIETSKVQFNPNLPPINVTETKFENIPVTVDKHFNSIYLNFNKNWKITFGTEKCLIPVGIHWHWGSDQSQGSEHKIDEKSYPMEGHLVSYNCEKYNTFTDALNSPNGLYVIGLFYQIGEKNQVLSQVIDVIGPIVRNEKLSVLINEINPTQLFPFSVDKYYRYHGSLTTPPCTQNVIWTVLRDPQDISLEQISVFRSLQFGAPEFGPMQNNFRPIQSLHTRVVFYSFGTRNAIINNILMYATLICLTLLYT